MKGSSQTVQTGLSLEYGIYPLLLSFLLLSFALPSSPSSHMIKVMGSCVACSDSKPVPPHTHTHPNQCSPCLRPPGFRKWSIIFMFRRHKPAPLQLLHALQLYVYSHFSAKGLSLPTPKLSYFTFQKYTVHPSIFCSHYLNLDAWMLTFFVEPSLSLTNDS